MALFSIVEDLDVIKDVFLRNIAGFVDTFFNAFLFQAAKKRLSDGIIPTISTATHARFKIVMFAESKPIITAVL